MPKSSTGKEIKMKNPLRKRYLRELKSDFGKYLVIFLFMVMLISIVSGYLVAASSIKRPSMRASISTTLRTVT